MKSRIVMGVAMLALLAVGPARAYDETCTIAGGSETAPHFEDAPGDWNGAATGNESGFPPVGDVHREGADLVAAWLEYDSAAKKHYAHIVINNLTGFEANQAVFMYWNHAGAEPEKERRYVQATFNGRGSATYGYGHRTVSATGGGSLNTDGSTSGQLITGTPGKVVITVPMKQMGNPQAGALLGAPLVETRFLLGAAGTGLYYPSDSTTNAEGCLEGIEF